MICSERSLARPPAEATPCLTFAPLAWLKLQYLCHSGPTEIGGFALASEGDPLYVEDFVTVVQATTCVTVAFDDAAVADHFDAMADAGRPPAECGRLWVHTHPGASPLPSGTDEETFARVSVEALVNGIPVLSSNRGGLPENFTKAGFVLDIPRAFTPGSIRSSNSARSMLSPAATTRTALITASVAAASRATVDESRQHGLTAVVIARGIRALLIVASVLLLARAWQIDLND